MRRRRLLFAAVSASALATAPAPAQAFPERPIRIVVPYAAGGATDVAARVLAEALSAGLPQPVVVENRSGAAGMVGVEAVARSPADGHTLLLNNSSHAALRVVAPNPGLDPHRASCR
jgi:tripartite-type tricarboxylate transporter receptor subunit TctC